MGKIRRPTAEDYQGIGQMVRDRAPTREEFIYDMREKWEEEFTEAEKRGPGAGVLAPIPFSKYLRDSLAALQRQIKTEIPKQLKDGRLNEEDASTATEFAKLLMEYEEQELKLMSRKSI